MHDLGHFFLVTGRAQPRKDRTHLRTILVPLDVLLEDDVRRISIEQNPRHLPVEFIVGSTQLTVAGSIRAAL
jgi:hypothetical protein